MPLNRLTAFFSNRAVSRSKKFECRAVFSSSLSGKLPAANAAAPLMPSGDPSQRGKSHYGLIAGALFLARGGYAERLARPPTVFGYMPAMADRRLPPRKCCRRCCAFLSAIVEDAINPFGVLERILYWWCSA